MHVSDFRTHNYITEIAFGNHQYFDQMTKIVAALNNTTFPHERSSALLNLVYGISCTKKSKITGYHDKVSLLHSVKNIITIWYPYHLTHCMDYPSSCK